MTSPTQTLQKNSSPPPSPSSCSSSRDDQASKSTYESSALVGADQSETWKQSPLSSSSRDIPSLVVKNEIKMKVAKNMRRASEESLPYPSPGLSIKKENDELTTDDEEKRRRRRLRNKIAAEKCRNKRKKAIEKLYSESETVAVQNAKFKDDIARLEAEHRQVVDIIVLSNLKKKKFKFKKYNNFIACILTI